MTRSLRSLILLLTALLVIPSAIGTQPAGAGKKFKTVTKTFSSDGQFAIPSAGDVGPANPYPSSIVVLGFEKGKKFKRPKITDVNVTLHGFSHQNPDDIDVLLIGPNNQRAILVSDVGGSHDANNLTLTLDDEAAGPLPDNAQLVSGEFRPTNANGNDPGDPFPPGAPILTTNTELSVFDGAHPHGQWQLFIRDDLLLGAGSMNSGWSLEITAKFAKFKKKKKS